MVFVSPDSAKANKSLIMPSLSQELSVLFKTGKTNFSNSSFEYATLKKLFSPMFTFSHSLLVPKFFLGVYFCVFLERKTKLFFLSLPTMTGICQMVCILFLFLETGLVKNLL